MFDARGAFQFLFQKSVGVHDDAPAHGRNGFGPARQPELRPFGAYRRGIRAADADVEA